MDTEGGYPTENIKLCRVYQTGRVGHDTQFAGPRAADGLSAPHGETLLPFPPHPENITERARGQEGWGIKRLIRDFFILFEILFFEAGGTEVGRATLVVGGEEEEEQQPSHPGLRRRDVEFAFGPRRPVIMEYRFPNKQCA